MFFLGPVLTFSVFDNFLNFVQILNVFARTNWRATLVPSATAIPAPIMNIKVIAVGGLVVEFLLGTTDPPSW